MFDGGDKRSFVVVDWHFMHPGAGISDVSRFLSGSLTPEVRRSAEMNILDDYVRILRDGGVGNYSIDDAMYDYRMFLLARFGTLISSVVALPFTEEQKRLIVEVSVPRSNAALVDHNCRSLLDG